MKEYTHTQARMYTLAFLDAHMHLLGFHLAEP